MYKTRKKKLDDRDEFEELMSESGDVWTRIVDWHWRTVRRKGIWLSKKWLQKWLCSADTLDRLSAASGQAVLEQFLDALKSWRREKDKRDVNPPKSRKNYNKVVWKDLSIKLEENNILRLSCARDQSPVKLDWDHPEPKRVELIHQAGGYEIRAQYEVEPTDRTGGNKVAGIDLGIIHLAAVWDGDEALLFNGRELRSTRNYQNKVLSKLQSRLSRKEEGSKRYKKLLAAKREQFRKQQNQIDDILHKTSRKLVEVLLERGVSTLAIGDVKGIQDRIEGGARQNQMLHQWVHGSFRDMIEYKAELSGMSVELISEEYTSQTCPNCENRHKTNSRQFDCPDCDFTGHRDAVGAYNIRKKYLREASERSPDDLSTGVLGAMASPTGIQFHPNSPCSPSSVLKT